MSFLLLRTLGLDDFLDDMVRALRQAARDRGLGFKRGSLKTDDGLIDADVGGGVIKQRIARRNEGRSRGFGSIILFRRGDRAFFVFRFAKGNRGNLQQDELDVYKGFADEVFDCGAADLDKAIELNKLEELKDHGKDVRK